MAFIDGFGDGESLVAWSPDQSSRTRDYNSPYHDRRDSARSSRRGWRADSDETPQRAQPAELFRPLFDTASDSAELHVMVHAGHNLPLTSSNKTCDSYVVVSVGSKVSKTPIAKNTQNPEWKYPFILTVPVDNVPLYALVEVMDYDPLGSDTTLGVVYIPLCTSDQYKRDHWIPLGMGEGAKVRCDAEIHLEVFVFNPKPISASDQARIREFCVERDFNLDVIVDDSVAEHLRGPQEHLQRNYLANESDDAPEIVAGDTNTDTNTPLDAHGSGAGAVSSVGSRARANSSPASCTRPLTPHAIDGSVLRTRTRTPPVYTVSTVVGSHVGALPTFSNDGVGVTPVLRRVGIADSFRTHGILTSTPVVPGGGGGDVSDNASVAQTLPRKVFDGTNNTDLSVELPKMDIADGVEMASDCMQDNIDVDGSSSNADVAAAEGSADKRADNDTLGSTVTGPDTAHPPPPQCTSEGLQPPADIDVSLVSKCKDDDSTSSTCDSVDGHAGAGCEGRVGVNVPGELEEIEVFIPNVILSTQSQRAVADLALTDFRMILMCFHTSAGHGPDNSSINRSRTYSGVSNSNDCIPDDDCWSMGTAVGNDVRGSSATTATSVSSEERLAIGSNFDLSTFVPLGLMMEVTCKVTRSGTIARAGGTSSGESTASSNSSGLGGVGLSSLLSSSSSSSSSKSKTIQLVLRCRDFRTLSLTFTAPTRHLTQQVDLLYRRLQYIIHNVHTQPPALHLGCLSASHWSWYNPVAEFTRQGALEGDTKDGVLSPWRLCSINADYAVCPTYPAQWCVPRCLDDDTIAKSAAFRSKGRLPLLCYYNKRLGNALVRCAQPLAGATGRRSEADEFVVLAVRQSGPDSSMLAIFDARSALAEKGNKLMGKGSEAPKYYLNTKVMFMEIQNIHAVRSAADQLQTLCEEGSEDKWLSKLEATGWLKHVLSVMSAGCALARKMTSQKLSCVVHCSDGWDRTSQLTSLCQLLLDPYFRTIEGFCVLIDKEWLSFGHMFTTRTFAPASPMERSPIFLLFLDCVWQIMQQFPTSFEFSDDLLVLLADHFQSAWFGNFLCDCERERLGCEMNRITTSIWSHIDAVQDRVRSHDFHPNDDILMPVCSMKRLRLWTTYFLRHEVAATSISRTSGSGVHSTSGTAHATSTSSADAFAHNTVVWVPDEDAKACKDCGLRFQITRRRHHCRACGNVFCNDCSKNRMPLPDFGYAGEERVCDECCAKLRATQEAHAAAAVTLSMTQAGGANASASSDGNTSSQFTLSPTQKSPATSPGRKLKFRFNLGDKKKGTQ